MYISGAFFLVKKYVLLNDIFDPTPLFEYRTQNHLDVYFIFLPFIFSPEQNFYKNFTKSYSNKDIFVTFSKYTTQQYHNITKINTK